MLRIILDAPCPINALRGIDQCGPYGIRHYVWRSRRFACSVVRFAHNLATLRYCRFAMSSKLVCRYAMRSKLYCPPKLSRCAHIDHNQATTWIDTTCFIATQYVTHYIKKVAYAAVCLNEGCLLRRTSLRRSDLANKHPQS